MEYRTTIGTLLLGINLLSIVIPAYGAYLHIRGCIRSEVLRDMIDHFLLTMALILFFFANVMATYTGYISFIDNPHTVLKVVIQPRIVDRTCMLIVGVILLFVKRVKKIPYNT